MSPVADLAGGQPYHSRYLFIESEERYGVNASFDDAPQHYPIKHLHLGQLATDPSELILRAAKHLLDVML